MWCALAGWSWSGHMLRLWVRSLSPWSGHVWEATDWCFSLTQMFPSLSISLSLSLKSISMSSRDGKEKRKVNRARETKEWGWWDEQPCYTAWSEKPHRQDSLWADIWRKSHMSAWGRVFMVEGTEDSKCQGPAWGWSAVKEQQGSYCGYSKGRWGKAEGNEVREGRGEQRAGRACQAY